MSACGRRTLLLGAGALTSGALTSGALMSGAAPLASPRLLAAGPAGGWLARRAALLAPGLRRGWPGSAPIRVRSLGGDDGVTGANRFEAGDWADGAALLLPGAAAVAWLAGDPRVHFDAARWLPVLCGVSGGALMGRRDLDQAVAAWPLRVALPDPVGPAAACLLGLDLLRVPARPVAEADGAAALRAGRADAAFLSGAEAMAAGLAAGGRALLTLGAPDATAADAPAVPALSALLRRAAPRDPALLPGWRAVAAAVQLDYALILPALSAPATVALWREAAQRAVADTALAAAWGPGIRPLAMPGCGLVMRRIATRSDALLAYRRWLAERLGYQPA